MLHTCIIWDKPMEHVTYLHHMRQTHGACCKPASYEINSWSMLHTCILWDKPMEHVTHLHHMRQTHGACCKPASYEINPWSMLHTCIIWDEFTIEIVRSKLNEIRRLVPNDRDGKFLEDLRETVGYVKLRHLHWLNQSAAICKRSDWTATGQ